jgi:hypothetical protein
MTTAAITGTYVLHEHTFSCQGIGNYPLTGGKIHEKILLCRTGRFQK